MQPGIPITYVPARNLVFLSIALAWAEAEGSSDLFIGVNALDYSGYPDCRPEFVAGFEQLARLATKAGSEGGDITIHAPAVGIAGIIKRIDTDKQVTGPLRLSPGEGNAREERKNALRAGG